MSDAIEFWVNRYQTLIAAFLAIVGIYWATKPVWRQVILMERQAAEFTRERLAKRYAMIRDAIKIIDGYSADLAKAAVPHPGDVSDIGRYMVEMDDTLQNRRDRLDEIKIHLAAVPLPDDARRIVDRYTADIGAHFQSDASTWQEILSQREPFSGEVWFHNADQPDRIFLYKLSEMRTELSALQDSLVEEIVSV